MKPEQIFDPVRLLEVASEIRDAKGILGCMPVNWEYIKEYIPTFEGYFPKAGSLQDNCLVCGQKVWVGPAQQEKLKEGPLPIVCCMCGVCLAELMESKCEALSNESGTYFFNPPRTEVADEP